MLMLRIHEYMNMIHDLERQIQRMSRRGKRSPAPVIYLDTSVALAHLLSEDRRPFAAIWREAMGVPLLAEAG